MSPATGSKCFSVSSDRLYDMLDFVRIYALAAGFDPSQSSRIELAVDEILTNIIAHSGLTAADHVKIECRAPDSPGLLIEISDKGVPFNPLNYIRPQPQEQGGHGINLARTFMDHLEYRQDGGMNILTITKYNSPQRHREHKEKHDSQG
jgi:serine/threonine-protein kinase RsbW